ncbi:MATE family efflux transporter, partial [Campylobacter concisus]|uniref:MATE family efflux transporter n=1 Tax=Campylobacter concisus TaxID=199 RepID=UPI002156017A
MISPCSLVSSFFISFKLSKKSFIFAPFVFIGFFGEDMLRIFDVTPAVLAIAGLYLGINSLVYVAYGTINVSGSTLQAIKRPVAIFLLNGFR